MKLTRLPDNEWLLEIGRWLVRDKLWLLPVRLIELWGLSKQVDAERKSNRGED